MELQVDHATAYFPHCRPCGMKFARDSKADHDIYRRRFSAHGEDGSFFLAFWCGEIHAMWLAWLKPVKQSREKDLQWASQSPHSTEKNYSNAKFSYLVSLFPRLLQVYHPVQGGWVSWVTELGFAKPSFTRRKRAAFYFQNTPCACTLFACLPITDASMHPNTTSRFCHEDMT